MDAIKTNKFLNLLNELSAKEWIKFQKSWFVHNPPPRDKKKILHPAAFPETLAAEFVQFFTKKGQWVLDPMVGTGSTLLACLMTGRNGIGIELIPKWAEIAKQRLEEFRHQLSLFGDSTQQLVIIADARNVDQIDMPPIDYVLTSPPYWDMLRRKGFENQDRRQLNGLDTYYSDDPADLGNISDYERFLTELVNIYRKVGEKMKPKAYMTIIVKNVKKGSKVYPLAWDLALRLREFFELRDEKIWCQDNQKLAPYGLGRTWVSNTMHHYCLIFRKP
ncbi:MAG: DNA methyltransferase [Armatimonadetes bacterium]|nr:DNA methyltransferase [Armatimonadota bacterium]MDW8028439.1 DNA methyltransferase [Armatimonadota bacterium]